jgi:tetratricopeptide (TPR) repeat protein
MTVHTPPNLDDAPLLDGKEKLIGVFSTEEDAAIGFGATRRRVKKNVLVYAVEQPNGMIEITALNKHFVPTGASKTVARETLVQDFMPEPSIYIGKVKPALKELSDTVARADAHREREEFMSAEFEYKNVLRIDESHIRSTFGLGLTYLDMGEKNRANIVFRRLIKLDSAFEEEHKHLFNDFAIKLRKNGMHRQALRYYGRAKRLASNDEHLLFNIARTLFELGKHTAPISFLQKALSLEPNFAEAKKLLTHIKHKEAAMLQKKKQT